jgi:hypothetical protein
MDILRSSGKETGTMRRLKHLLVFMLVISLAFATVHIISAQQRGGVRQGGGRQFQGRQMDPEAMLERMLGRIMDQLELSADESAVLKPMIEGILRERTKRNTEMQQLRDDLQKAIDAKSADQMKAKLAGIKAKRKEHKTKSEAMEKKLLELLSVEQEAKLTILGVVNGDGSGMRFGGFGGRGPGGMGGGRPGR